MVSHNIPGKPDILTTRDGHWAQFFFKFKRFSGGSVIKTFIV